MTCLSFSSQLWNALDCDQNSPAELKWLSSITNISVSYLRHLFGCSRQQKVQQHHTLWAHRDHVASFASCLSYLEQPSVLEPTFLWPAASCAPLLLPGWSTCKKTCDLQSKLSCWKIRELSNGVAVVHIDALIMNPKPNWISDITIAFLKTVKSNSSFCHQGPHPKYQWPR